jgi:hypothetical protein
MEAARGTPLNTVMCQARISAMLLHAHARTSAMAPGNEAAWRWGALRNRYTAASYPSQ